MIRKLRYISARWSWAALILLLPFTSLPLVAQWVRTNSVAGPSVLPLFWLGLTWFLPFVFLGRGKLPAQTIPFLGLVFVCIIASAQAHFIDIPRYKGVSLFREEADALLTLGVGVGFYLLAASWPRSTTRLRQTMILLNWSGALIILWSLVQGYYVVFADSQYPDLVVGIQKWASLRRLYLRRVTGFAYEPSWLAHQLNMLWLPFWLAASVQRTSAHRRRLGKITLENVLLVGGVVVLGLSFSRVGWLAFGLMLAYPLALGTVRGVRTLQSWAVDRWGVKGGRARAVRWGVAAAVALGLLALTLGGGVGAIRLAGIFDPRLNRFFERFADANGFYDLTNRLAFAERVIFWAVGWEIFNDHPFLGVGLGNAGFFFAEKLPSFGWNLNEVKDILFRRTFVPNTKSLWIRLLAETGIVGFAFFSAWLYTLWKSARCMLTSADPMLKTVGLAGALSVLALFIEGFSVDSFALPYIWFSLGLLTAGARVFLHGDSRVDSV